MALSGYCFLGGTYSVTECSSHSQREKKMKNKNKCTHFRIFTMFFFLKAYKKTGSKIV